MTDPNPYLHVDRPDGDGARGRARAARRPGPRHAPPVRASQLAVLRMAPFVTSLRRAGAEHGLAVARLRYLVRGWNGAAQSPVPDVRWALDRLAEQFPGIPVALVGHSMGGRAAVYAAGHDSVRAVVGLAPWIEPGDPVRAAGRPARAVRARRPRPDDQPARVRRLRPPGRRGGRFGQLHRRSAASGTPCCAAPRCGTSWPPVTSCRSCALLSPEETVGAPTAKVLAEVLAGTASLVV